MAEDDEGGMPVSWPQPHEGIRGADRDDWLLSLDGRAVTHREALIAMAAHLSTATLVGAPAPVVARMNERLRRPEPGDLAAATEVVLGRPDPDSRLKGFGVFLAERTEWACTDAEWEQAKAGDRWQTDEDRTTDKVFYLQYGPGAGDICRWADSAPVALPVTVTQFGVDAAASRTATRAEFTRDSLAGSLADSGFRLRGAPDLPETAAGQLVTVSVPDGTVVEVRDAPAARPATKHGRTR